MKLLAYFLSAVATLVVYSKAADLYSEDLQNQTTLAAEATTANVTDLTTEPNTTEPATTEPGSTEPATTGPASTEPATTGPATTEPKTTGSTAQPTTTPTATENTYAVFNQFGNVSCIVLRGDITFTNIAYNSTDGGQRIADPISIPSMNMTGGYISVAGSCGNSSQQMIITFHRNWNLTLTFARGSDALSSSLGASSENEYSLRDIQFDYILMPEFFPNTSNSGALRSSKVEGLEGFLQGKAEGGSYKCDSQVTRPLQGGVQMETTHLQYKAFNTNGDVNFSDGDVSECPADEGSDHTVAIAVGASLGGLILIMLIAYLIGRRSRRQKSGYDSF